VALNIRHPDADSLARALAAQTGESLTDAVIAALRERLQREAGRRAAPSLREDLRRVQRRYRELPLLDSRTADEILGYDEHGLPA
jgi:antitoxin VapB